MKRRIQTKLRIKLEDHAEMWILEGYIWQRISGQMNVSHNKPRPFRLYNIWTDDGSSDYYIDFDFNLLLSPSFKIKDIVYYEEKD